MYDINDIVYGIVLVEPNIVSIMRIVIKDVLESLKNDKIMYDCELLDDESYRYMIKASNVSNKIEDLVNKIEELLEEDE